MRKHSLCNYFTSSLSNYLIKWEIFMLIQIFKHDHIKTTVYFDFFKLINLRNSACFTYFLIQDIKMTQKCTEQVIG